MLTRAGVTFHAMPPGVDEEVAKAAMLSRGASPLEIAEALADEKALAVSHQAQGLVIGADQTLELDGELHDKTASLEETRQRLRALRGRWHQLHAAVAVAREGAVVWRAASSPRLKMRDFSDPFLEAYLAAHGQAVASSVGAYHLEGAGAQLFDVIDGDYFSVLGLPLIGLLSFLRSAGGMAQ
jgi:septum formation protein